MSTPIPSDSVSIADLLEPISAASPCGGSLRYENDYGLLRELRREDDTSLPTGVWQSEIKRGDWAALEKLARDILANRSKDLMVAAWLGEAWLHRDGLGGLCRALELLVGLCETYPNDVHPLAEEGDQTWRAAPFDWLVRRYAEILHTRSGLFEASSEFNAFTLSDWQQLQQRQVLRGDNKEAKLQAETAKLTQQKLNELIRATPVSHWLNCLERLLSSQTSLDHLERWSDATLGEVAPSYSPLRSVIAALTTLMQEYIAMHPQRPAPVEVASDAQLPGETADPSSAHTQINGASPSSREDAYRQLVLIAEFLARTEPHSPVPYLIHRAVEWGSKPLGELLPELLSTDPEVRRVWTMLGVLK